MHEETRCFFTTNITAVCDNHKHCSTSIKKIVKNPNIFNPSCFCGMKPSIIVRLVFVVEQHLNGRRLCVAKVSYRATYAAIDAVVDT